MPQILPSEKNIYQGRWINSPLPSDPKTFVANLDYSLHIWQAEAIKVVWLSITTSQARLIPLAVERGFCFHHSRDDTLTLTKRLVANATIPDFANHTLGVGSIVFNDNNEVLAIVEKHDMQTRPGHWKFPGGAVDSGELVRKAAVREVFEETGIHAKFIDMVGLRHYHKGQFGTSNIYIVCRLHAVSETITPCPREIGKAKWFDIDAYLACDSVITFNKALLRAARSNKCLPDINLGDLHGTPIEEYEIFAAIP